MCVAAILRRRVPALHSWIALFRRRHACSPRVTTYAPRLSIPWTSIVAITCCNSKLIFAVKQRKMQLIYCKIKWMGHSAQMLINGNNTQKLQMTGWVTLTRCLHFAYSAGAARETSSNWVPWVSRGEYGFIRRIDSTASRTTRRLTTFYFNRNNNI